jgi:glycine cleavage system transcriptional repressor
MPSKTVVLTGVGRDRVGIVADIAQVLFELGCNLLDSSMTLLRGEFALILMVELPANLAAAKLEESLKTIGGKVGMAIHMRELTKEELSEPDAEQNSFIISVYGADRTGIVAGITRALADAGINITDVQTKSVGGDSNQIFVMILEVSAAASVTRHQIEKALSQTAGKLGVDISVQALEAVEL